MTILHTITTTAQAELSVKHSKFIGWIAPASNRQEAERAIAQRAQEFADATHNCTAFRVNAANEISGYADDAGEPAGSAGRPMLQVLESRGLVNMVAVVSRYFGGIKLGIGGLIRAYSGALQAALAEATLRPFRVSDRLVLEYNYPDSAVVEKVLHQFEIKSLTSEYHAVIKRVVELDKSITAAFCLQLQDASAGRVNTKILQPTDK